MPCGICNALKEASADCEVAVKDFTSAPVAENTAKEVGAWFAHSRFWAMAVVELDDVSSTLLLEAGACSLLEEGVSLLLDAGAAPTTSSSRSMNSMT